jgi:hypothetical protein
MADLLCAVVAIARGLAGARDHRRDSGRRGDPALACLALVVAYREVTGSTKLDWMWTAERLREWGLASGAGPLGRHARSLQAQTERLLAGMERAMRAWAATKSTLPRNALTVDFVAARR